MALDPRIGLLNSGRAYAFVQGYDKSEFVGTVDEVTLALGLTLAEGARDTPAQAHRALRTFRVEVAPRLLTYAGSATFGPYTVTVTARSHSEAITQVRQARNAQEGRYGVPARYRATVVD